MKNKNIIENISKKSLQNKYKKSKKKLKLLNRRYFLEEYIADGGLSTVYKATDIYCEYFNDKSNMVIKIPTKELLKKKDISAFVYAEYTFLKKLNHDNIVKVFDYGIDEKTNIPYLVLKHIKGPLLSELSTVDMSTKFKNSIFKNLYSTLNYIHSKNIIHADINPSNIIISDNIPIIFDFGISQNIEQNKDFILEYKKVKAFNPKYSAPEVLKGKSPSIKSDIFSFACLMYELYTSQELFKESSLELENNLFIDLKINKIPLLLRTWFISALNKNPKKRHLEINFINFLIIK